MFPPLSESIGKILDGLLLMLSGIAGLIVPLFGIFALFAYMRWLFVEPKKALRLSIGSSIMFLSIFVAPICFYAFDLELKGHSLLFLASVLVSVFVGVKIGTKIMGKYGDEIS